MIKTVPVLIEELSNQGKNYKWEKPVVCPRCPSSKLWGHGYVTAFFEGFSSPLWLKRLRCNHCKIILILRPEGYFSRYQSSIKSIYEALVAKLRNKSWPKHARRQRCGQWLRRYLNFIKMQYGDDNGGMDLFARLQKLFSLEVKFLCELK
jgi:hypothetical protein